MVFISSVDDRHTTVENVHKSRVDTEATAAEPPPSDCSESMTLVPLGSIALVFKRSKITNMGARFAGV